MAAAVAWAGGEFALAVAGLTVRRPPGAAGAGADAEAPVLHDVSFVARPGEVTAIVGRRRAGKTTLLRALAGLVKGFEGQVHVCAQAATTCPGETPPAVNVPCLFSDGSDEHLLANIAVEETLLTIAKLVLPHAAENVWRERVERLIRAMRLQDCRRVNVGSSDFRKISSGERRRVALACALLNPDRAVLLLDEPTLAVDSAQSREIMDLIRSLARQERRTVVVTMDNPTSGALAAVDRVVLLHRGACIFAGPLAGAREFIELMMGGAPTTDWPLVDVICEALADLDRPVNAKDDSPTGRASEWATAFRVSLPGLMQTAELESVIKERGIAEAQISLKMAAPDGESFCELVRRLTRSTLLLTWRFMLNGARYKFWFAPFLLALVQAFLMSSVMFRPARNSPSDDGWQPNPLFGSDSIRETALGAYLMDGASPSETALSERPRRPEIDVLVNGVDGRGSRPMWDFFNYRGPPPNVWWEARGNRRRRGLRALVGDAAATGSDIRSAVSQRAGLHSGDGELQSDLGAVGGGKAVTFETAEEWGTDNHYLQIFRKVARCIHERYALQDKYFYPPGFWETEAEGAAVGSAAARGRLARAGSVSASASDTEADESYFVPGEVLRDAVTAVQLLDFIWNVGEWGPAAACDRSSALDYYICVMLNGLQLAPDVVQCHGNVPELMLSGLWSGPNFPTPEPPKSRAPAAAPARAPAAPPAAASAAPPALASAFSSTSRFRGRAGVAPAVGVGDIDYDQEITHWDSTIAAREWAYVFQILDSVLPDISVWRAFSLAICPATGDCSELPDHVRADFEKLKDLAAYAKRWLNDFADDEVAEGETGAADARAEREAEATVDAAAAAIGRSVIQGCRGDFCRDLKSQLRNFIDTDLRRFVNQFKIHIIQRQFPRLVTSFWVSLLLTGGLFGMACALGFFCFDALLSFHSTRKLAWVETGAGFYNRPELFLAKNLSDLMFQVFPAVVLAVVWGAFLGVVPQANRIAHGFCFLLIAGMLCFAAYGFCYFVSAVTRRTETALIIAPLLLITWVILAGFILRDNSLIHPVFVWLRHISPHRYGWFALMHNRFPGGKSTGELPNEIALWLMGSMDWRVVEAVAVLAALGIGYRIAAFFAFVFLY